MWRKYIVKILMMVNFLGFQKVVQSSFACEWAWTSLHCPNNEKAKKTEKSTTLLQSIKGEDTGQYVVPRLETNRQMQGVIASRAETPEWKLPWEPEWGQKTGLWWMNCWKLSVDHIESKNSRGRGSWGRVGAHSVVQFTSKSLSRFP